MAHYVGDDCPGGHKDEAQKEGVRFDEGKIRWDLLPVEPLEALAQVYTIGAKKYSEHNWRKGMQWSRILSAMLRHLAAWRRGKRFDQDDGFEHLAAVLWGAVTLMEYERLGLGEDDRLCGDDVSPEYVAGLIDGEGCITALVTAKQVKPVVQVTMTTRAPLERLMRKYGGNLHERQREGTNWKPTLQWFCPAATFAQFLTDIIPHLALKSEQAKLALELWTFQASPGRNLGEGMREKKEALAREIQALNQGKAPEPCPTCSSALHILCYPVPDPSEEDTR